MNVLIFFLGLGIGLFTSGAAKLSAIPAPPARSANHPERPKPVRLRRCEAVMNNNKGRAVPLYNRR